MNCDRINLQAYYDGELPVMEREVVEAHLSECAACRQQLAELSSLSRLISGAPLMEISGETIGRLNNAWSAASDRGVLRMAGWLTAAAAVVLIAAVLNFRVEQSEASTPALWQTVAVMSPDQDQPEEVVMAQWMADDLSIGERR